MQSQVKSPFMQSWLLWVGAALAALLIVVAINLILRVAQPQSQSVNLPTTELAPAFAGVDQHNQAVSLESLRGKVVVMAPIFIHCRDICPLTVAAFARIQKEVEQNGWGGKVALITATVDPERDTPAALDAYAQQVGAKWTFMTAAPDQLNAVWKSYGVSVIKAPLPNSTVSGDYDVQHNGLVVVIDGQGQLRYRLLGQAGGRELTPDEAKELGLNPGQIQRLPGWEASDVVNDIRKVLR